MTERLYVVGLGGLTCLGTDIESTWEAVLAGRSGLKRHESLDRARFALDIAGVIEDLPATDRDRSAGEASKLNARFLHLAIQASRQAWTDAGLDSLDEAQRAEVAVMVGSALGGMDLYDAEAEKSSRRKSLATSPYLVPGLIANQAAGQVARDLQLLGPSLAPANACASGGHAVILGATLLRSGEVDLALCGATESCLVAQVINGFSTMRALYREKDGDRSLENPEQASRPFSVDRGGFVMSEGAAMLVLARESAVRRLGLTPMAELAGWAWNSDGHHMAMPHPPQIAACLRKALRRAEMNPEEITHYNAHGTSTVVNDASETQVIKEVFGPWAREGLAVSSIKGAVGHSLGAASAIEAASVVKTLREQVLPPTIHHQPDPELDLDYVPGDARPQRVEAVMSVSLGFGGTNNALVFRAV